uniref:Uncharacterized protein n=1 Tax=Oryctolagus cuniculus TaxID=9986 RepID=A0A5F9DST0_RABIT
VKTPFGKTPGQRSRADAGPAGVSADRVKKRTSHRKPSSAGRSKPDFQPRRNIVRCKIQRGWEEGSAPVTQWKGAGLDQVPANPSLCMCLYLPVSILYLCAYLHTHTHTVYSERYKCTHTPLAVISLDWDGGDAIFST